MSSRPTAPYPLVLALLGTALLLPALALGWVSRPDSRANDGIRAGSEAGTEPAPVPAGWTEFPLPPEVRSGATLVWAGDRLVLWGGCDPDVADDCSPTADGFVFDPRAGAWSPLPAAPVPGSNARAAWTGDRVLLLTLGSGGPATLSYDPVGNRWERLASPPPVLDDGVEVWTGREWLIWGSHVEGGDTTQLGAAYDPALDTWRPLPPSPLDLNLATGVWTGKEMIVFGSLLREGNHATSRTSQGATYDPARDAWRELPPSELSPQATSAAWLGDRLVAWDYEVNSQSYEPVTDEWSAPQRMPLEFSECYPDTATVGAQAFAFFCGQAAVYDGPTGGWSEVHGGPLEDTIDDNAYGTPIDRWRFADMDSDGHSVYLLLEGITLSKSGEACYGCEGSPFSFWAFTP